MPAVGSRSGLSRLDPQRGRVFAIALVVLAALLVYANSLSNGFAYDDDFIIKMRGLVHGLHRVDELLTAPYWPAGFFAGLYRPLTLLSFALDWAIWDGNPFGFHLTNVVLHAAISGLVTVLILEFFPWWAALAGGLMFAVHPVHTEAVANVVGRAELLAALFVVSGTLVYVRAVRGEGLGRRSVAAIVLLYAFGSFSKEMAVVMPGLLVATDLPLLRERRMKGFRAYIRGRVPLFAAMAGVLALVFAARWMALGTPLENQPDRIFALDASFSTRLFTMARVWPRYFELFLFPAQLSADYSPAVILPATELTPLGAVGFGLVLGTLGLAVVFYRRAPKFAMAVAWAAVAILPVSNLIVMAEIILAERTLYIPSIAVSFVAALLLSRASADGRRLLVLGLGLWVVGFSLVTVRRNPTWESTDSVFEDLRRHHPESSRLLWGVASQYYRQGDWDRAREWFYKSLEVWPHHAPYLAEFALYLTLHGEHTAADSMASRAVRLNPKFRDYRVLQAMIRVRREDFEGALQASADALEVLGADATLYTLQSEALAQLGRQEAAVRAQEAAVRAREPAASWNDWLGLAQRRWAAGDTLGALTALREARNAEGARPGVADSLERLWKPEDVSR